MAAGERHRTFALRDGEAVIGTLVLPATLSASERERVAERIVPALQSVLAAALHRAELQAEVEKLTGQVASLKGAQIQNNQLREIIRLGDNIGISSYRPVAAHVIGSDPSLWYDQIYVDAGSR